MFIRLHKGQHVDAIIPGAVGVQPSAPPGDIVLSFEQDINPSKTIQVTQNVQDTDPISGQLLFDDNGQPVWKTIEVTNPDGSTTEQVVTQQVPQTITLLSNPNEFTLADLDATEVSYVVVGSLDESKTQKTLELRASYVSTLNGGFKSSADGTEKTYGFAQSDIDNLNEESSTVNAGIETFPIEWADKDGNPVSLTQTQWTQLETDAKTFKWAQVNHLRQQLAAVETATTTDSVNAIAW
jgi:hypothetical protein